MKYCFTAEAILQPRRDRNDDDRSDDVGGDDPGRFVDRRTEIALDRGQGDVDDRSVERLKQRREHHTRDDQRAAQTVLDDVARRRRDGGCRCGNRGFERRARRGGGDRRGRRHEAGETFLGEQRVVDVCTTSALPLVAGHDERRTPGHNRSRIPPLRNSNSSRSCARSATRRASTSFASSRTKPAASGRVGRSDSMRPSRT